MSSPAPEAARARRLSFKGLARWFALAAVISTAWCWISANKGQGRSDGALTFLENRLVDSRFRFRGPIDAPVKVVYVDVDSASIAVIGGMPWNRAYFSLVSRALIEQAGVRAVGMDFVFSDEGRAESVDLDKLVQGNVDFGGYLKDKEPPIVLGASYSATDSRDKNGKPITRRFPNIAEGLPPLDKLEPPELPELFIAEHQTYNPPGAAIIDTVDNGTRWLWAYAPSPDRTYYHMGIELARIFRGLSRRDIRVDDRALTFTGPGASVLGRIPLTEKQLVEINWFSTWKDPTHNTHCSFDEVAEYAQLLDSDKPEDRRLARGYFADPVFKDAVVLIGPVDPLLQDLAPTPMDENAVPKVSVHGNFLKTVVSGRFIKRLPPWGYDGCVFLLTAVVVSLVVWGGGRGRDARFLGAISKLGALALTALYVAFAYWLFGHCDWVIPLVAPVGSTISTCLVAVVSQVVEEQRKAGRTKTMFATYVPPAVVERIVDGEDPHLGGAQAEITAYFSDIQSFSTFSEKLSPTQLVELMNEFLTACTDIVLADGGTLDKYIGDAVVAIYGAPLTLPGHPHRACVSALRVQKRVAELREKWRAEGEKWPPIVHALRTRIGLNSGPAVVGNMGSHTRFSYTMMGDNVNLAARMESGAKSWGVYTMCAESTRLASEAVDPRAILFRKLAKIVVKGRSLPVPIHEVVSLRADVTADHEECVEQFERGLDLFYARDWAGATRCFERSAVLEEFDPGRVEGVKTNPSLLYLDFTREFAARPPPPDWDGVHHMTEK